jgi:hypothetical protein
MNAPIALAIMLVAAPAFAQTPAQPQVQCIRAETIPGFEAWGKGEAAGAPAVGKPVALTLSDAIAVKYEPAPSRAPEKGSYGGVFPLDIAKAGTYSIALSGKAWIEVVRDGASLKSSAHREGTPCSGIRKIVSFELKPGRYWLQLTEATGPAISALIVPAG